MLRPAIARSMAVFFGGSTIAGDYVPKPTSFAARSAARSSETSERTPILGTMEALHSLADVRRILGVSRPTVHRLVRRGELPVIKVGSRTLIEPADLRDYLAAKKRRRGQHDDGPAANAPDNPPRSPR